ncbi:hypothetical protein, partial [Amycolatopsis arida]|uniref:hypothetical protein n=1 Tax=Amycolatopsis arida TaxID=587909 RepID=UPI0014171011
MDATQLGAQFSQRPAPLRLAEWPRLFRFGEHGAVLGGACGGHGLGKAFLGHVGRLGQPHVGRAAGGVDVVGDPVEVFAGTGVGGQRDQPVADLGHTEAFHSRHTVVRGVDGSRGIGRTPIPTVPHAVPRPAAPVVDR